MMGIYRERSKPDHIVRVIQRDDEGISYEDGGKIVCTKRIRNFDRKFWKDHSATLAEMVAGFRPAPAV